MRFFPLWIVSHSSLFSDVALSFVAAPASFAETIKSAEPISSLTLATLTRGEDSVSTAEWLTTLPIVVGVALSSYGDSSFHIFGFFAASLSNFLFSMRGLNTKQLRRLHGTPHGLDDMHLFRAFRPRSSFPRTRTRRPLLRVPFPTGRVFRGGQFRTTRHRDAAENLGGAGSSAAGCSAASLGRQAWWKGSMTGELVVGIGGSWPVTARGVCYFTYPDILWVRVWKSNLPRSTSCGAYASSSSPRSISLLQLPQQTPSGFASLYLVFRSFCMLMLLAPASRCLVDVWLAWLGRLLRGSGFCTYGMARVLFVLLGRNVICGDGDDS